MVFADQGPPTHVRGVWEKTDVWNRKRDSLPPAVEPLEPTREDPLDREGTKRPENGRPGNPTGPWGKAGATSSRAFHREWGAWEMTDGPEGDARETLEETGLTGTPLSGRDRISMPRYTSDWVGTRDDFVRLTWMPSSVHTVRSLVPRL